MPTEENGGTVNGNNPSWMDDDNDSEQTATRKSALSSLDNDCRSIGHEITALASIFFSKKFSL